MAEYRKKPVVIEAFRFPAEKWPEWFWNAINAGIVTLNEGDGAWIHTLEGKLGIANNAYVIRGIKGELYACDPEIFAETYEAV